MGPMRTISAILVAATLGGIALPGPAHAAVRLYDPDQEPFPIQDVKLNAGLFSAVGLLGITYDIAPLPFAELELGAGFGMSGYQFSVMPKVLLGWPSSHFLIGLGVSLGVNHDRDLDTGSKKLFITRWLNADIGYEGWWAGGYSFLWVIGFTRGLSGCAHSPCNSWEDLGKSDMGAMIPPEKVDGVTGLQGQIAIGRWF